jgi:thiamine-monophosphate kinase
MDISDGLSLDLYRLTQESRVGAEIRPEAVPVFPGATLDQALHGGEEYELLFTCDPRSRLPASAGGVLLSPIGVITAGRGVFLVDSAGRRRVLPIRGFAHQV